MVPGDNAEGFLDGAVDDYRTSSLLAPDCKFGRFQREEYVPAGVAAGVQLTTSTASSVLLNRKMLIKM